MLVLTRKPGQKIAIGDDVVVTVVDSRIGQARIGVEAPRRVTVDREEVRRQKRPGWRA